MFRERFRHGIRRALLPRIKLPLWVSSTVHGTRFFLSRDPIDDLIVDELLRWPHCFFPAPETLQGTPGVILDIGGHHGLYAAEALRRYPDRSLIVVEPHPDWCRLVHKNLAANGATTRFRIVRACLAADGQPRVLHYDPESSWGATLKDPNAGGTRLQVASLRLSAILAGEPVAMIYCNAEGAEYELIAQLREHSVRPAILILCVHPEYGDADQLRRNMQSLGYEEKRANSNPKRPIYHYTRGDH